MSGALLEKGIWDNIIIADERVIIKLKATVKEIYRRGTWVFMEEEPDEQKIHYIYAVFLPCLIIVRGVPNMVQGYNGI